MSNINKPYSGRCVSCNKEHYSHLNQHTGLPEDMCVQCRGKVDYYEMADSYQDPDHDIESVIDDLCHIHQVERSINNAPLDTVYNMDDVDGVDYQQEYLPHEYN